MGEEAEHNVWLLWPFAGVTSTETWGLAVLTLGKGTERPPAPLGFALPAHKGRDQGTLGGWLVIKR